MSGEEGIRSFANLLASLEDGQLLVDLSTKMHELNTKLARESESVGQAKGELVLKLKCACDKGSTVQIDSEIVMKEPKPKRSKTMLWLTSKNNLVGENPKQQRLPLREVAPPKPARDVSPDETPPLRSV